MLSVEGSIWMRSGDEAKTATEGPQLRHKMFFAVYPSHLVLASFPGCRRNGLTTSASSNCYFCGLKVGRTNQAISPTAWVRG